MREKRQRFLAMLLTAFMILLSGCDEFSAQNTIQLPAQIKIGMMLYQQDDTFISLLQKNFETYAKQLEVQNNVKIVVNVVDAKGNQGLQNEQVDQFLSQNYDVLCVNCVDRTAASVIIDKAKSANIPVIFFNREPVLEDLQRWDKVYYVGSQAQAIGDMQGKIILDHYLKAPESVDRNQDERLQYIMLEGEAGHQDSLIRTEYSIKALTSAGVIVEKLASDTANWQRSQAFAKTSLWIEKFGDRVEVIFCNNDDMALGVIEAYESAGILELPLIVGADATPVALSAVKERKLTGTVLNDYDAQANAMLKLAYALATGVEPSKSIPELSGQYYRAPSQIFTLREVDPQSELNMHPSLLSSESTSSTISAEESEASNTASDEPSFVQQLQLQLRTKIFASGTPVIELQPFFSNQTEEPVILSFKRVVALQTQQAVPCAFQTQTVAAQTQQELPPIFLEDLPIGSYRLELNVQGIDSEKTANLKCTFSVESDPQGILASPETLSIELTILPVRLGLSGFRQTLSNTSEQNIGFGREYRVEVFENNEWIPAVYPTGKEPSWTEEYIFLDPGGQMVLEGVFPFDVRNAEPGLRCRIVRNVTIQQPEDGQDSQIVLTSIWEAPTTISSVIE